MGSVLYGNFREPNTTQVSPGSKRADEPIVRGTLGFKERPVGATQPQALSSADELQLIQHLAPVGLLTLDVKGMIRQANTAACELMAMRRPTSRVAPLAAYVHPSSCEQLFAHIARVFRGDTEISPPLRFRRCDSQVSWIQLHSRLHAPGAGGIELCFSALLDVTRQHRAEQSIRDSEQSFRDLLAQLPDGVVVLSDETIDYANRHFARLGGERNPERLTGCRFTDYIDLEQIPAFRAWLVRMSDSAAKDRVAEFRMRGRNHRVVTSEMTAIPTVLGGRLATVLVVRDVTHTRRMRAELEQANRLATVGVLAAGVAHEINNPLNYIMLNLESARRDLEMLRDVGEGESLESVETIDERLATALVGSERVRDIVRCLNSFARVDVRPTRVSIADVVKKASAMAAAEMRPRARVLLDLGDTPVIEGVEGRLCQVLLNLLVNAAHAIEEGDADNHVIRITTRATDEAVIISVADSGCGIPEDQLSRIFDPFYTTKAPGKGSGLGLSLCRNYIESHGGRIGVNSVPGRGTVFDIELPLAPDQTRGTAPSTAKISTNKGDACSGRRVVASDGLRSAGARRVLIVDDEPFIREVLSAVLGELYVVDTAGSGNEAIGRLRAGANFDLVICDLMMPHGNGMEFYDVVARDFPALRSRIVFLTGGAHTEESNRFLERIEPKVAFKPLSREEVLTVVADALADALADADVPGASLSTTTQTDGEYHGS